MMAVTVVRYATCSYASRMSPERHDRRGERRGVVLPLVEQLDEARDVAQRARAAGLAGMMRPPADREQHGGQA